MLCWCRHSSSFPMPELVDCLPATNITIVVYSHIATNRVCCLQENEGQICRSRYAFLETAVSAQAFANSSLSSAVRSHPNECEDLSWSYATFQETPSNQKSNTNDPNAFCTLLDFSCQRPHATSTIYWHVKISPLPPDCAQFPVTAKLRKPPSPILVKVPAPKTATLNTTLAELANTKPIP